MASEEAMKQAKALVDNFDGARQMEGEVAIATALDAARAAGRAEGLREAKQAVLNCVGEMDYTDGCHDWNRGVKHAADAIDALAKETPHAK
jgi:hypothetical protein